MQFFSLLLLKSAVQIKLRFFRSPNVIYTFSASLSGSDFQPCGLLTIFTAIQSFSYGSRLAAFGMEINPFNPNALDVSTCGHDYWQKWGEAERSETLLLTLERALFKFSAPAPPLEVLLKLEPRIGTASSSSLSAHIPAVSFFQSCGTIPSLYAISGISSKMVS